MWFVGSVPGDSKQRPGLRTWLLVRLVHLRAEPRSQSEERQQGWSSWIWTGEVSQLTSSV